jgi:hypothetical protein
MEIKFEHEKDIQTAIEKLSNIVFVLKEEVTKYQESVYELASDVESIEYLLESLKDYLE